MPARNTGDAGKGEVRHRRAPAAVSARRGQVCRQVLTSVGLSSTPATKRLRPRADRNAMALAARVDGFGQKKKWGEGEKATDEWGQGVSGSGLGTKLCGTRAWGGLG